MNLSLSLLDWIVCTVVILGSLFFGLYMAYKKDAGGNSSNFFLGGRSFKWPIVGASLFATNIGAEHLIGLSGDSYRYGLSAGSVELTIGITLGFACALLFPYYMKNKVYTIPEFLEIRYNRRARTLFSGLMVFISIMTKMAFTLFASALVFRSILGWDVMTIVFLIGIIVAVFTIMGGLTAVAYTDTLQVIIMIFGASLMLYFGLDKIGGWDALVAKVPESMHIGKPADHPYSFWGIMFTAFYAGIFYWGIDQVNVQRVLAAKDIRQARWGAMFACVLKLLPIFIFALPGVIAYALYPGLEGEASKETFVWLMENLLPSGIRGLLLASLIAAMISSLIAVLNSVSTMLVRDFVMEFNVKVSENRQVYLGRVFIFLVTLLGIAAAYMVYKNEEGLYKYLQTITSYLVIPIFPAIFFGICSKRITLKGAAVSVMVGLVIATIFVIDQIMGTETATSTFPFLHTKYTTHFGFRGLWAETLITAVLFGVSAFTKKTDPEKLSMTTINYSGKIAKFEGLKDWRLHLAILALITFAIMIWLY